MIEAKIYEKDRELFDTLRSMPEDQRRMVRVTDVPFSKRSLTVFNRLGIRTLGQLQTRSKFELLRESGMGKLCYEQAAFFMRELALPMELVTIPVIDNHVQQRAAIVDVINQLRDMAAKLEEVLR